MLGLGQIILGGLMTNAGLANLGAGAVMQGVKDCFTSIFNPQELRDLRAYYSDKVLRYTIDLVSSGFSGIEKLAKAGKDGV